MNAPALFAAVSLLCTLAFSGSAAAGDKEVARALFEGAIDHMEAQRYDKACPAIAESYKLDPQAGTLFTLAECEAKRGHVATAAARYDEYLALYETLSPEKRAKQSNRQKESIAQKAALLPQTPELTLVLPKGAPPETTVKRDGVPLDLAKLGQPLAVDPGEHVITTQGPFGPPIDVLVTLGKAEKQTVVLKVNEAPPASSQKSPSADGALAKDAPSTSDVPTSSRRAFVYVAGGAGIAGLVLGGVTGGLALSKKTVIKKNCDIGGDATACNDEGLSAASEAKTLGIVSTVGFAAGVVGLGVGVALWLTEPAPPQRAAALARPAPKVSFDVLSAGREGAIVGLRGRW